MRMPIFIISAFLVGMYVIGCGTSSDGPMVTEIDVSEAVAPDSIESVLSKVAQHLPELNKAARHDRTVSAPSAWEGDDFAQIELLLKDQPENLPSGWLSQSNFVPVLGLSVQLVRYSSASEAQKAVQRSLRMRPAAMPRGENYKNVILYRYDSVGAHIICSFESFIIEVVAGSESLTSITFKVLDSILSELRLIADP